MQHSPALGALIEALRALPGVGPKSAQRMAFHLLQDARPAGTDPERGTAACYRTRQSLPAVPHAHGSGAV